MLENLTTYKDFFEKEGYCVVKNVFTEEEISLLRKKVYQQFEIDKQKKLNFKSANSYSKANYVKGDLLSKELLYSILLDDRILKIAQSILDSKNIVYFGDSAYQIGTGLRGYHRDNIDRNDLSGPDWQGSYTIIRMGIYLQDHKNYSGGLKIKKGSHKNADGKSVFVNSEIGDVALWSLKTYHSGNAVRLKLFPNFPIDILGIENFVPSFLKKNEEQERVSLFITFALKSMHLDRYVNEYVLKRNDTLDHIKASVYRENVLEEAKQKKLEVIKLL